MSHNHDHLTHPKYRSDIDGLRAVAILSVVGFHAFPNWVHGGFIGVDIFFVISGYLISTIIMGSLERNSFSFVEFYIRRINRIFPALLLVLIACFAFGWYALLADEYKQLGKHIAGGAGFISNFLFWNESGHFDNAAETKPLLHLWSLGIEEQFYLAWPLLLWIVWKNKLNFLTVSLVVVLISFGLNIAKINSGHSVAAFYSPQTRFWELLVGSVLAYLTLHRRSQMANFKYWLDSWLGKIIFADAPAANGKTLSNVLATVGIALLAIGALVITKEEHFPGWWAILPTMGAVLIISAGAQAWFNRIILSNRLLVWFGLISFPLYLWHWPLLSFARIVESETPARNIRITAVLLSIVLAWLTYRLIEKPIRFGGYGKAKAITLTVLMFIIGFVGFNDYIRDGLIFRDPTKSLKYLSQSDEQQFKEKCTRHFDKINHCAEILNRNDSIVLMIGDSHIRHTFEIIKGQVAKSGYDLVAFSSGGCPFLLDTNTKIINDCASKNKEAMEFINSNRAKIKFILLTGEYSSYMAPDLLTGTNGAYVKFADSFYKTISKLSDFQVVVIEQVPPIPFDPKKCIARPFRFSKENPGCQISKDAMEESLHDSRNSIYTAVRSFPNVNLFNLDAALCSNNICTATVNNDLLSVVSG